MDMETQRQRKRVREIHRPVTAAGQCVFNICFQQGSVSRMLAVRDNFARPFNRSHASGIGYALLGDEDLAVVLRVIDVAYHRHDFGNRACAIVPEQEAENFSNEVYYTALDVPDLYVQKSIVIVRDRPLTKVAQNFLQFHNLTLAEPKKKNCRNGSSFFIIIYFFKCAKIS